MKSRQAILEYRPRPRKKGQKQEWGFRFKTQSGKVVMESHEGFSSLDRAEKGFLSMIKSIATNQYAVAMRSAKRAARRRSARRSAG